MNLLLLVFFGALLFWGGITLLRLAVDGIRRERRLQRRLPPVQHHSWHVIPPRPYDWREDGE